MCDALAVVLVLNKVQGFYSAGSGSPSEDWGKIGPQNQFSISLCCSCEFLNCAAIHTHSTTTIAKIYTPDSAIYSLQSKYTPLTQQYTPCDMPYMTTCGPFDPPTHYNLYLPYTLPWFIHNIYAYVCIYKHTKVKSKGFQLEHAPLTFYTTSWKSGQR